MRSELRTRGRLLFAVWIMMVVSVSRGQIPDHPIITEVFNNPAGTNDGPVGRDPANLHQEFIEIYLPTVANLRPSLVPHKDALHLTFYEIEGDSSNSERGWVNQRFDLPTFDLDGCSPCPTGTIPRPSSGVVVLGWVDYNSSDPSTVPSDLFGTPGSRRGLINVVGGITTSPTGVVFVAMNGAWGIGGTTNFPTPVAESLIDVQLDPGDEQVDGVMRDGSNVYLLFDRDDPNYLLPPPPNLPLIDSAHAGGDPALSDADLPGGSVLGRLSLLDGIAGNDDPKFRISAQPYIYPTGLNIDLEDILRAGGVFTPWVAQIPEASGAGYARRFVDQLRTTEDATAGNENPETDARTVYRQVFNTGPFYPTPGSVVLTTSPPELGIAQSNRHAFNVLANTTGRPGLISANLGGNCPIDITATAGACMSPCAAGATFGAAAAATGILGQSEAFPQIAVTVPMSAAHGAVASAPVSFSATNAAIGACNPPPTVVNPNQTSGTTITVLKPTTGLDGTVPPSPYQTTVFLAVQGFGADPAVANEFRPSSLGTFVNAQLGNKAQAALGHIGTLLNPATNLEDNATMDPLKLVFPSLEADFINAPGTPKDLARTVRDSAKIASGSSTYAGSLNALQTAVKAIQIPIPETLTKAGTFSPTEFLFFADSVGIVELDRSGLARVTTSRTFELAILDTNMTADPISPIEDGDFDDFGLIVQVGRVRSSPPALVVPGQLIFLSYMGGLEGEDIDSVDVPGINATVAILLDLDNLDDVLGCKSITKLFVVDAGGTATLNVVEALSLHAFAPSGCQPPDCNDGNPCTTDSCVSSVCQHMNNTEACDDGLFCNGADSCSGGTCSQHAGDPCPGPDGDGNCAESCNETSNNCTAMDPNGSACNDGLFCTFPDTCSSASCVAGPGTPCINPVNCNEATNTCTGELPVIVWNPATGWPNTNPEATTRSLRFRVDAPAPPQTATGTAGQSAIKVTMIDLQHPVPPNLPAFPPPNFSGYECTAGAAPGCTGACSPRTCVGGPKNGATCVLPAPVPTDCPAPGVCTAAVESGGCGRWVGRPGTFLEDQDVPGGASYKAARLQCSPFYWDWVTETMSGPIAVYGGEIAPSSEYSVQTYGASCKGLETDCTNVSAPVTMYTRRSSDVEAVFNPPGATTQPDAIDVAQVVAKVKNLPGALVKSIAQLQPNLVELNANVSALDIVDVVDRAKGFAYAFSGPCPCPSTITCGPGAGSVACATATPCVTAFGPGALCVKTCVGGTNAGEPCIDSTRHCPGGGVCGVGGANPGFCRDRCGRCTP